MLELFRKLKRLPELERQLAAAEADKKRAEIESFEARNKLNFVERQLADADKRIRAQNEADLMLLSWQIMTRLAGGEKRDSPAIMQMLASQQAMASNLGMAGAGMYGGALSGLGNLLGAGYQLPYGR